MRNYKAEKVSLNIRRCECRVTRVVKYEAKKFGRQKMFDTLKEAEKYVDRVCIELGKKQVYNTFKQITI